MPEESANQQYIGDLARRAKRASQVLATSTGRMRSEALEAIATRLRASSREIIQANEKDLRCGKQAGLSQAMLDRLTLDEQSIGKMADSVEEIARAADPVGEVIAGWTRPDGLVIHKLRVPLGVVAVI